MKKWLSLSFLGLTLAAQASHILGGMIGVAQTSQDSTTIGVVLLIDQQGTSPNLITIEKWQKNSVGFYVQVGLLTATKAATGIYHQGYEVANYTTGYLDLDSGMYRFVYTNCCRGYANNSPSTQTSDFITAADYWHIPNNSTPFMTFPIPIHLQVDTVNVIKPMWGNFNCHFVETDGDSVKVFQDDILAGHWNNTFVPIGNQTSLSNYGSYQVRRDSIRWAPNTLGQFQTGFIIEEWRNGQKIGQQRVQWTFKVLNSTLSQEEWPLEEWYRVHDFWGKLIYEGNRIPYGELNGFYVVRSRLGVEKIFVQ